MKVMRFIVVGAALFLLAHLVLFRLGDPNRYAAAPLRVVTPMGLGIAAAHIKQQFRDALIEHSHYIREHGEDMPQIRNWVWPGSAAG